MVVIEAWFFCISGLVLLMLGAERFIDSSIKLSKRLNIPPLLVGLTVVSLGTSAPELFVSVYAAIKGSGGMTMGNIIGSNISNLALIGGVAAFLRPIQIKPQLRSRDLPLLILVTLVFVAMLYNGKLERLESIFLLFGFFALLWLWIRPEIKKSHQETGAQNKHGNLTLLLLSLVIWLVCLFIGTRLTVKGAVDIATYYGVSERMIGLTLVAFGTSLPELAATVAAAWKRESDIAIGNLVGSNLSNILLVGGAAGVIAPVGKEGDVLHYDLLILTVITVLFLLLINFARRSNESSEKSIGKIEGVILSVTYVVYLAFVIRS